MRARFSLLAAATLVAACTPAAPPRCPQAADLSPSLDAGWFEDLAVRLQGPDRENSVIEAVDTLHRGHPEFAPTMIEDIVIAADCPAATHAGLREDAAKARIAELRGQVDVILASGKTSP